ncbi:Mbeg1-like protein [Peptostreptococcus sp.]|uniref:Mbeg1-like protein n=1 Tax=Peptostreptococcus sp. TaxID=1262 RepID=UPI002FC9185B
MDNIIDYIDWRGDLTFEQSGFNEVDNMIFSQISYLNLGVIKGKVSIAELGQRYIKSIEDREKEQGSYVTNLITRIEGMFLRTYSSNRFKDVLVSDFINKFDEVNESQFSAMTFTIDSDTIYVAFRGTDDTIIGFKENLNMSFSAPVPGQLDSVSYLKTILDKYDSKNIMVGGHSKGGNFAVFAVSGLSQKERDRISTVYNNDGPGFTEKILKSYGYKDTVKKVKKYIPKDSFVGILMDDEEKYIVVNASGASGILQHDGLNWEVKGKEFVKRNNVTEKSEFVDKTVKYWLEGLDKEQREEFVDELYNIVKNSTNANRLNEISENRLSATYNFIRKMTNMDSEKREMMQDTVMRLIHSGSEVKKKEKERRKVRRIFLKNK